MLAASSRKHIAKRAGLGAARRSARRRHYVSAGLKHVDIQPGQALADGEPPQPLEVNLEQQF